MLGWLGFQLFGRSDVGDEREVDIDHVRWADVLAELPYRFQEWKDLDVADSSTNLGDHHVDSVFVPDSTDPLLDLVGDVRNHLHGVAEIVASALLVQNREIHRTGCDIRITVKVFIGEPLVVSKIEICLAAVIRYEHLTMLKRVHRAWIDVDVRIELLIDDLQTAGLEESTKRCGGDAFSEARGHAARYKHVFGHGMAQ